MRRSWRDLALAVVCCAAALVGNSSARSAEPPIPTIIEGSVLPPDAAIAVYVRPAELARSKSAAPIVEVFDVMLKSVKMGISVADVEEFKIVCLINQDMLVESSLTVIRAKAAHDWKSMFDGLDQWTEDEFDGRKVFRNGKRGALWLPDARTVVFVNSPGDLMLARSMESPDPQDTAAWSELWEEASKRPLAVLLSMKFAGRRGPDPNHPYTVLAADSNFAVASGYFTIGGFQLEGIVTTDSPQAAARAAPVLAQSLKRFAEMIVKGLPLDDKVDLADQLTSVLNKSRIKTDGNLVRAEGLFNSEAIRVLSESVKKAATRK